MNKPKILLVDDSKPMLRLVEILLSKKYEVFAASSAVMALDWLHKHPLPDLIITDIQMPVIGGVEFTSHLANNPYYCKIPILVLSGYNDEEINDHCRKLNIEGYLTKPFDPVELKEKIKSILCKRGYFKTAL